MSTQPTTTEQVATLIKTARNEAKLSVAQLAEKANFNVGTLGNWERGARTPKAHDFTRLMNACGVKVVLQSPAVVALREAQAAEDEEDALPPEPAISEEDIAAEARRAALKEVWELLGDAILRAHDNGLETPDHIEGIAVARRRVGALT